METLLVVGASGLVGGKVATQARGSFQVVGTHRGPAPPKTEGVRFVELHKERVEDGMALVRRLKPSAVIDTAALHNVDRCEEERDLAWQVNAGSTGALARVALDVGGRYLFVSTDFVFDGRKGRYLETDVPRPVNYYGETKLAGEHAVLAASPEHLVVRPSVVFGWDDSRLNFATWVLSSLKDGKPVSVATDWIGSPTFADSLAAAVLRLLKVPDGGVYHLAGPDPLSRYDFAVQLATAFGLDPTAVKPVTSGDLNLKAPRPPDSSLSSGKAKRRRIAVVGANEGIAAMKEQRTLDSFVPPTRFKS
jgi:dTDP-4-dehydrorhamnose reductase